MHILSSHRCFDGTLLYAEHQAEATRCTMRFTLFLPPKPAGNGLIYLSGLGCTEDNFTVKAGAYRKAAECGLAIIAPDTSPRGEGVPHDSDANVGFGSGFYINATVAPWHTHYRMEEYVVHEVRALLMKHASVDAARIGICGHSMGGHGALTLSFKYPQLFHTLSALAPLCSSSRSPLGHRVMSRLLGSDETRWQAHDAVELLRTKGALQAHILIDQGTADVYLPTLSTPLFAQVAEQKGQKLTLRMHEGYDHGYFFIQSVIDDHIMHHAEGLKA